MQNAGGAMRHGYDHQRQARGYHEYQQMLRQREQEERTKWCNQRSDTLGVEPDFPVEVLEQQE